MSADPDLKPSSPEFEVALPLPGPQPRLPLWLELISSVFALGLGAVAAVLVALLSYGETGGLGLPLELTSPLAGATLGGIAVSPMAFSRWGRRAVMVGAGVGALLGFAYLPFV
jgi:hypothetical protein